MSADCELYAAHGIETPQDACRVHEIDIHQGADHGHAADTGLVMAFRKS